MVARRATPLVEWILKSRDTERIVMALLGGFAVPENAGYVAGCVEDGDNFNILRPGAIENQIFSYRRKEKLPIAGEVSSCMA